MQNYLTEVEGSAWEVGDDKVMPAMYVWETVSFIVMQL